MKKIRPSEWRDHWKDVMDDFLSGMTIKQVAKKHKFVPCQIEDVIRGWVYPGGKRS